MNNQMKAIAKRMWGTITPTVEQVEKSYGRFCKRDEYDVKFGKYTYSHPVDQAWFNDPNFIRHMTKLSISMRVVSVLSEKYLRDNGRMNDEAMVKFYGSFENMVEWILYMTAYTTIF